MWPGCVAVQCVMQCVAAFVAVCCSVMQCDAVCCSVLERVAREICGKVEREDRKRDL